MEAALVNDRRSPISAASKILAALVGAAILLVGTSVSAQIRVTPTITSTSLPVLSPLPTGVSVRDEVFVSGSAGMVAPTGTVTFFLCQPFQVTPGGCVSGGAQVGAVKTLTAT